ncbi:barstar family protein [Actinacidiphila glaucinigra]|uniref:barstar family protein n=1 Tax=Actinacidiphila glaucinigra TaxID=235986 RepID=UPI0037CCC039
MTTIYVLDGTQITTLESFWYVVGEAVNGPGGYFGRNPDAFNDCPRGGFGTPDDDAFEGQWRDHAVSRDHLGYAETVRQLELRLAQCHPTNRPRVAQELAAARDGQGPMVFNWLVEIFEDEVPGSLQLL